MAGAAGIRAGGAFVEIFARDGKFHQAMGRVEARMRNLGRLMQRVGTSMALGGTAIGLPLILAARQAATFEDALLGMKAAAGLSAKDVSALEQEALRLSAAMGIDPANIANAFLELTKAGMSVEEVLKGAGKSAVEFARVSGVDMADAAVFMKVAMNTFGVSATQAVDTLSAAADASETSIAAMVESFALVGSAGKTFDQSLFDVSQGLAALAKYGIRGEEAGTGIKTMLMRLVSPASTAHDALAKVGLTVASFRDADGKILPIVQIVDVLAKKLKDVDRITRDQVLGDVFGDRGIRVVGAFLDMGVAGFDNLADAMEGNLPVAAKFDILMSGITGGFEKMMAAVKRLSIAFAGALGSSMGVVTNAIVGLLDGLASFVKAFPMLSKVVAGTALGLFAFGTAAIFGGIALKVMATGLGVLSKAVMALFTPMGAMVAIVVGGIALIVAAAYRLSPTFKAEADAIMAALSRLDFASAWEVMNLNLAIALTQAAQQFENAFAAIKNTVVATADFIGDKLTEGLDRFLSMFGADILSLQGSLEKLGIYFRSAFDFSWATGEMQKALDEVDARMEQERAKAGTADERAAGRTGDRQTAADSRQERDARRNAGYDGTVETLRQELDMARRRARGETAAKPEPGKSDVKRSDPRKPMEGAPAAAGAGEGRTVGTFSGGALAGQLGIGPVLDVQERVAAGVERAADGIGELVAMGGGKVPDMGQVKSAIAAAQQAVDAGGASLNDSDKELLSAAEKTALGVQSTVDLLRQLVTEAKHGGLAFV